MTKIKTRALLYNKGPKVKKYAPGGYFNSGENFNEQQLLYPNLKKPATLTQTSADLATNITPRPTVTPIKSGYRGVNEPAPSLVATKPIGVKVPAAKSETPVTGDKAGAVAGAGAAAAGIAGEALSSTTDEDDRTYTGKEKAGDISGAALKGIGTGIALAGTASVIAGSVATGAAAAAIGATAGSVVPIIGTAIGAIIGTVVGIFKSKKAKKKAKSAQKDYSIKVTGALNAKNRANLSKQDSELSQSLATTGAAVPNVTGYNKEGGTFHWTLPKNTNLVTKTTPTVKKFKRGGKVKETENIIPNGVLHEEKNSLGDNGMPVVKCKNNTCSKQYEIERDEMILTLKTTKEIERLAKGKKFSELGEFVKKQVLQNTHSFTNKFVDLNNYKGEHETIYS